MCGSQPDDGEEFAGIVGVDAKPLGVRHAASTEETLGEVFSDPDVRDGSDGVDPESSMGASCLVSMKSPSRVVGDTDLAEPGDVRVCDDVEVAVAQWVSFQLIPFFH